MKQNFFKWLKNQNKEKESPFEEVSLEPLSSNRMVSRIPKPSKFRQRGQKSRKNNFNRPEND